MVQVLMRSALKPPDLVPGGTSQHGTSGLVEAGPSSVTAATEAAGRSVRTRAEEPDPGAEGSAPGPPPPQSQDWRADRRMWLEEALQES